MRRPAELLRLVIVVAALLVVAGGAWARARQYVVNASESADSNHTAFDEKVVVDGQLNGDVQLVGGELTINGTITGDVVTLGTDITFGPHGRVTGDVISIGGTVNGATRDSVAGDLVIKASGSRSGADLSLRSLGRLSTLSLALQFSLLLLWLVAAVVITLLGGKQIRASSLELRASPLHTLALGLVAFTSFILTLVVFALLIPYLVGVPLIVVAGVIAVLAKVYGMVTVFHAVGSLLFAPKRREELATRGWWRGDLALTVAGLLVLGLIRLVPLVGPFIWMVASLFGIGSALATRFGRREPWFLAVRQVSY
jgi:hypothetical protein